MTYKDMLLTTTLKSFSMVKPSKSNKTLHFVSADLFYLCELFKTSPQVKQMTSFKLMERVLNEQCNVVKSDKGKAVEIKKPKDISSSSLHNPSDPDATFMIFKERIKNKCDKILQKYHQITINYKIVLG